MAAETAPTEFAAWLEEHLGLHGESPGNESWGKVLRQRLGAVKVSTFQAYRAHFASPSTRREELYQLAQFITVGETYFFRDSRQFEALTTVVLPELLRSRGTTEPVRVLSVACSTGEEPYSVAIAARELLGCGADRVQIHAFDVNAAAIRAAKRGCYSEWALRATPSALKQRYFVRAGNQYVLIPAIRDTVSFEVRNLFDDDADFFRAGRFDVVLCRNVLIYFSRRRIARALELITQLLAHDGILFLGNAETPRGIEQRLVPREVCGSFCYRVDDKCVATWTPLPTADASDRMRYGAPSHVDTSASTADSTAPDSSAPLANDTWVAVIDAATRRLANLVDGTPGNVALLTPAPPLPSPSAIVSDARDLVAHERFAEALTKLDALTASGQKSREVDLLRASILTNQGRFVESNDLCRKVLSEEPRSAGAHYLLAVASEHLGRKAEAVAHYEQAIALDPGFTMAHWLLGRLCLKQGQSDKARRHFTTALEQWRFEASVSTNSRLYDGGFGRDAMEKLCRADLARCEGRP